MSTRKRYAQVGTGSRGQLYSDAIVERFPEACDLVGLCDRNEGRLRLRVDWCKERGMSPLGFAAEDFDRMIEETRPDCVIVTTIDCSHAQYVCRAMEMCCDVIVEKPMAIDEQQCRQIVDTQRQTGRKCQATFNMRYGPWVTQVKDLLMSGVIGEVLSVDFSEMLNTRHGASYFRRWHRNKANSGGLLLHKASHHFDVINWWLSALPVSVFAAGHRAFYTPQTALRYGLTKRGERCLGCPESGKCPFYLDIREPLHKALYLDQEQYDGYIWDGCVFSEAIDIEDAMDLVVTYDSGAKMSYSLNVFVPWEGLTVSFNGTKGRLEVKRMGQVDARGNIEGAVDARAADPADRALVQHSPGVVIFPHFRQPYAIDFWTGKGGHGGADPQIVEDLFSPDRPEDKYMRLADQRAGAYAILTGIAGNRSIETGKAVQIDDLCRDIGRPDFPPMPSPEEPLPTA